MRAPKSGVAMDPSGGGSIARYRPDIDGLRAVAVFGVLLYHLDVKQVPGGFAGVDVFFVISGFLITQMIREELRSTGTLDFNRFFQRRIRRLFPALLVVVVGTLVCGAVLFSPDHLKRLGGAGLHALLSASNFFFWTESGYFDADARFKPLLHTWSLGVEAQFYLVWPILIVALHRLGRTPLVIAFVALAGAGSLYLNHVFVDGRSELLNLLAPAQAGWFSDGRATIFYLLPFRIFEFAIGAALVFMVDERPLKPWLSSVLLIAGLGLIVFTFATVTSAAPWPQYLALVPCIGAAMVISANAPQQVSLILTNPLMVALGLFSYSLYLVHWPIIVFVQYVTLEPLSLGTQAVIAAVSTGLAGLIYRFVERPFHKPDVSKALSPSGFSLVCAAIALCLVLPASSMWATQGWTWRYNALIDEQAVERYKSARFVEAINACRLEDVVSGKATRRADGILRCKLDAESQIVVMGDSHAVDGLNTLTELYRDRPDRNVIYSVKDGGEDACLFRVDARGVVGHDLNRTGCAERAFALNSDVWENVDLIVLDVFNDQARHYDIVSAIAARHPHLRILILGPYIGTRPYNCSDLANRFKTFDACKDDRFVSTFGPNPAAEARLPAARYTVVDRRTFFCKDPQKLETCATTVGSDPIFVDGDHLTLEASRYIATLMRRDEVLTPEVAGLPP